MNATLFKVCPCCAHEWPTRERFLEDPTLQLGGYQAHFEELTGGLFMFTHSVPGCGTSLAIQVKQFSILSSLRALSPSGQPAEHCPQHCMRQGCLDPCPELCECTWVRDLLKKIDEWPKALKPPPNR